MRELRAPPPSSFAPITPVDDVSESTGSPFSDVRSIRTRPPAGMANE